MIKLKVRFDDDFTYGKEEKYTIDCPALEELIYRLWRFNNRQGDIFSLGELLEILIFEGAEVVSKQIGM